MVVLASTSVADLRYNVKVQGVEDRDVLKEGLKPSELGHLTIDAADGNVQISEFEIVHARGKSALMGTVVTGNTFDLHKYQGKAKAGDRIVIKVNKISGENRNLSGGNDILQILIK